MKKCWLLLGLCIAACGDRVPASGTPAYNELHGIRNDGASANEIILDGHSPGVSASLRIPAGIPVFVFTNDLSGPAAKKIRRGYAHSAELSLVFDAEKEVQSRHVTMNLSAVRLRPVLDKDESFRRTLGLDKRRYRQRLTDNGLIEFIAEDRRIGESAFYTPADPKIRDPGGERIVFGCGGMPEHPASGVCHASYIEGDIPLGVSLAFSASLLPHWRAILDESSRFTHQIYVRPQ